MINLQSHESEIKAFIISSVERLKERSLVPVRAFGIQCSPQDGIIVSAYDKSPERRDPRFRYCEVIPEWNDMDLGKIFFSWDETYYSDYPKEIKDVDGRVHIITEPTSDDEFARPIFDSLTQIMSPLCPFIFKETGASVIVAQITASDLTHEWKK